MWFLGRASSGLLQSNNLRGKKQGLLRTVNEKILEEFTFDCGLWKRIQYSDAVQEKNFSKKQRQKEARSEAGEVVPTLKMLVHPLQSFHVLGLLPL